MYVERTNTSVRAEKGMKLNCVISAACLPR